MSKTKIPVELRQAIAENKLIIFVGAGLSYNLVNTNGQPLKGWGNLVREIIIQLQDKGHDIKSLLSLLDMYEPIEVLHLIEKHPDFSREAIYDITADFLELDDSKNDYSLHQKLNTLSKKIITTNYDIAFEKAVPTLRRNKAYKGRNYKLNKHRNSDAELLFKLHGCLDHLDNMILFPTDYKRFYHPSKKAKNEKYALDVFKNIINNNSVLFIGTGMGDFQINNIFKKIKRIQKDYGKKHFIITNKSLDSSLDFLTPIEKKHTEIVDFIDELLTIKKHYNSQEPEEVSKLKEQIKEYENRLKELESKTSDATAKELLEEEALKYFTKGLKYQLAGKFKKAVKQYKNGLRLNSKEYTAYTNWGNILSSFASEKQGEEAERLFNKAIEKFQQAIKIEPNDNVTHNSWGVTLGDFAKTKKENEAEKLYLKAFEHFEKAIIIDNEDYLSYANWGIYLRNLADKKQDKDRVPLLELAIKKFEKAILINPNEHKIFLSLGTNISKLAIIKESKEKDSLFEQAFEKYKKAAEISPNDHEIYSDWGNSLGNFANSKEKSEAEILYNQAFEKFKKSISLNSNYYFPFVNWGVHLMNLADIKQEKEKTPLIKLAIEKYQKAIKISPNSFEIYNSLGFALTYLAKMKKGKEYEKLYSQALQKLKKGIELGGNPYNLACLYALQNKKEEAILYLNQSLQNNDITIDFTLEDADWKNYLEDPDFLAVIEKYK
ncbi:SIR2 family protein [uncultured Dokdonia sp.]|uniref:SIR2 family protein n=1 Tax=uncultured Dokdonia sp. TaxID=575653 RepID=UPI002608ED9F|nr:SIR2 family protein [uncultured Dokdonia sp.]